jgi:hypothetical protein
MASKLKQGSDSDPVTIRAARINGKYVIVAAIISTVGAVVAAAVTGGFGLAASDGHDSAPAGTYYRLDMTDACQTQHHDSSLSSQYENWNDPNSWVCVNSSGAVVGTVNIQAWCDYDHAGSTAVIVEETAYGWRCRTLLRSLIARSPKHSCGGNSKGSGLAPERVGHDGPSDGHSGVPVWRSYRDDADDLVGQVRADDTR